MGATGTTPLAAVKFPTRLHCESTAPVGFDGDGNRTSDGGTHEEGMWDDLSAYAIESVESA